MKRILLVIFVLTTTIHCISAQDMMLKTNLLYAGATFTPNIGAEIRLNSNFTLDLNGAYNPWNLKGSAESNKKLVHWMAQAELRYYTCRSFDGHFFGVHLLASQYNIIQRNLDFILGNDSEKYRFQGYGIGAGLSYGYQWVLSKNWSLEATVGIGAMYLDFDKYECRTCGKQEGSETKIYLGPTRLGINLIYYIR
ncbi:MAG: DUF3575 domain-containing protein [Bacteroidales bacterium]|nr:DUF3575 domain-containing protein [Bacteroidales bacterium]